ncbi:Cytochrome P450 monooxygenase andK [Lachnellula suecica]|uniref:Cytochrome P450 monooxygenase andK n=1 Tax=Lachnellula suecica TaxID=602035 RepID=A0A8T9BXU9_9HELO|nr:Cytochrome P450 monooxygenase andK [Lachnellula suecica]
MAQPAPDLKIPSSTTTVSVRIIDTTSRISGIPLAPFVTPEIKGFTELDIPAFSFLIEHPSNRKLLFDLGVRKDKENLAPKIKDRLETGGWKVETRQGVREQLEANGVKGSEVEGIVWSHWHWDHTGDPSTFDSSTALIVGPGFKDAFTPGYPAKQDSPIRESDYEGRELREIAFNQGLKIGRFNAFDYFGDGSFYLLDSPGHAIGHMCGLARVTANNFIFMGGDSCHHGGELRPSKYLPLPSSISPNPLHPSSSAPCPGSLFEPLYRDDDGTKPFYAIARLPDGKGVAHDEDEAEETIGKVIEADANDEVLVVMAHDDSLLDVVDFFPKYANDFKHKGWVEKGRWLFLKDFKGAVKE